MRKLIVSVILVIMTEVFVAGSALLTKAVDKEKVVNTQTTSPE